MELNVEAEDEVKRKREKRMGGRKKIKRREVVAVR